ncbi:MAG: single-stranded-DNA-specific exonuclease RecJ [Desulfosarcina sp.]|nr:single-stranded-DNA-specific exonuclease RecJ [Desulfobacterales bacterium]
MDTIWDIQQPDPAQVQKLSRALDINPLAATLLINRGLTSIEAVRQFLNPALSAIQAPPKVRDIEEAAQRIARALTDAEKILVFGDYDVDGVTGTAVLLDFIAQSGGRAEHYIPHRRKEGYGLQARHVRDIVIPGHFKLIITVDCGISSHEAVEEAARNGIDVIITDHHTPSGPLPRALAVVNPKRDDCPAGLDHLAGVGMAFYLLIQLRTHLRRTGFWRDRPEPNLKHLCDLVALGTIADMVPLVRENRTFTQTGLQLMASSQRPGLVALMAASRVQPRHIEADDISFRLAPRINAAGRMAHADLAVALLTTPDPPTARNLARKLDDLNRERQKTELEIVSQIVDRLERNPREKDRRAILLLGSDWHEGVLGIAAARLMRRYAKPVILVSGNEGLARGSAPSLAGIDIFALLQSCADLLHAFGGHAMAAGITIEIRQWEAFRQRFWEQIEARTDPGHFSHRISIDMEISLDDIDDCLFKTLAQLKPFGAGVPEPVFMARAVDIVSHQIVGGKHRRMRLRSRNGTAARVFPAIQFNVPTDEEIPPTLDKVAFHVRRNTWNGSSGHQLHIIATVP